MSHRELHAFVLRTALPHSRATQRPWRAFLTIRIGTGKTGSGRVPAPQNRQRATRPEPYFLGAAPIAPRNCRQWTLFGGGMRFRPAFQTMQNRPLSIRRLDRRGEASMRIGDLFQWERFVTPTII